MPNTASGGARPLNEYSFIYTLNIARSAAHRLSFRGAGLPRAAPGGATGVEFAEHAGGGRGIPRAEFAQAAPGGQSGRARVAPA